MGYRLGVRTAVSTRQEGLEEDPGNRHKGIQMDGPYLERMPQFSTVGRQEQVNLSYAMRRPLSGYLGGVRHSTGYFINQLSDQWCATFGCKHAIPCNSATSGLLAACMAIDLKPRDVVWTTAYSMSATAACAKVLGAEVVFVDIETVRFSLNMNMASVSTPPKAIIVTNLFGHPAYLSAMRSWCDANKVWMIEDNAQAPFAMEGNKYAGTVGHIGVFSFNVHKHIQAGEGGVVVSDDEELAGAIAGAINHGELATDVNGGNQKALVGLNLRMTEPIAAIACAQLVRGPGIIETRRELAAELTDMFSDIAWVNPQGDDVDCKHVYYRWVAKVRNGNRDLFVEKLKERGVPMLAGYSPPLNRVFKADQICPVAEYMEDHELISFGICEWNPKRRHLNQMREVIKFVAGALT